MKLSELKIGLDALSDTDVDPEIMLNINGTQTGDIYAICRRLEAGALVVILIGENEHASV